MDSYLMFKEQYNRCMKKASAAEARLGTLTTTYCIFPESVRAFQVVRVQAVTLYGSELWRDRKEAGRWDDLHLLFN
jgi:hypothetical protein